MNHAQEPASSTYRVLRELGVRTQSTFAALRGKDLVVVQRFPRSLATFNMIHREALCLAKNWHPNVNRVRHVDLVGDELFVATELVDGMTLSDLFAAASAKRKNDKDPILPPPVLIRIVLDVLGGLHCIHTMRDDAQTALKTIHGAVCARNIVVGKDGVARLVAVFRPRPVKLTDKSESLRYAAPEMLEEGAVDHRSDLYACGVILWEGLQGKRLFNQKQPSEILHQQREGEIEWHAEADNAVKRLKPIVLKALEFDPALRFASGAELVAALRRIAGAEIATGSAVAHKVMEIAGERIKARRLELERASSSTASMPAVVPGGAARIENQDLSHAAEVPPVTLRKPDSPLAHAQSLLQNGGPLPQRPLIPTSERKLAVGSAPIPTPNAPFVAAAPVVVAPPEREIDPTIRKSPTSDPALMKAALPSEPRLPTTPKSDPVLKAAPKSDPVLKAAPKSDPSVAKPPAPPPSSSAKSMPGSEPKMKAAAPASTKGKAPAIKLRESEPILVTSPLVTRKVDDNRPLLVNLPPKEKPNIRTSTMKASPAPPSVATPPTPAPTPTPQPTPQPTPVVAAAKPSAKPVKPTLIGVAPPADVHDDIDIEPAPESLDAALLQSEPVVPIAKVEATPPAAKVKAKTVESPALPKTGPAPFAKTIETPAQVEASPFDAVAKTIESLGQPRPEPTPFAKTIETPAAVVPPVAPKTIESPATVQSPVVDVESEPLLLVTRASTVPPAPPGSSPSVVGPPPAPVRKAPPPPVTIAPMPKVGTATRPIVASDVPTPKAPESNPSTPVVAAAAAAAAAPPTRAATRTAPILAASSPIPTPTPMAVQSSNVGQQKKGVPLKRAMAIIAAAIMLTLLIIVIVAKNRGTTEVPGPIAVKTNRPAPVDSPPTSTATGGEPIVAAPGAEEEAGAGALYPYYGGALGDAGAPSNDPAYAVPEPTTTAPPVRKTPYEPLGI